MWESSNSKLTLNSSQFGFTISWQVMSGNRLNDASNQHTKVDLLKADLGVPWIANNSAGMNQAQQIEILACGDCVEHQSQWLSESGGYSQTCLATTKPYRHLSKRNGILISPKLINLNVKSWRASFFAELRTFSVLFQAVDLNCVSSTDVCLCETRRVDLFGVFIRNYLCKQNFPAVKF